MPRFSLNILARFHGRASTHSRFRAASRRAAPRRVASRHTALHRRVLAIYIVFYAAQLFSRSAVALDLAAPEHTIARETANETQATTPP